MLRRTDAHGKRRSGVRWIAAAGLLMIVPWGTVGCGDSKGDRTRQVAVQRTTKVGTPVSKAPVQPIPRVESIPVVPEAPVEDMSTSTGSVIPEDVSFEDSEAAFHDKRYEEASDLFAAYTKRRPENVWGHYMLGLSARKAGDQVWAEEAFVKALEIDPGHVKSLLNLSRVLLDSDRPDEALERIEAALEIEPESNDGQRLLGRAHYRLGDEEKAIEAYREAILLDQGDAWSMNNVGLILIRQERFEEAVPPLARAVQIRNDIPVFQNNLGIALERTGYLIASADAYGRALDLDGSYEKVSISLSRVEELEGDPDQGPVDLVVLAERFVQEIEGWRETMTAEASPETIETESGAETDSDFGGVDNATGEETKDTGSEEEA